MSAPLFRIENLRLSLPDMTRKPMLGAAPRIEILKGLSFEIAAGSTLGIVGESGSGKSTLGRAMVRLLEPTGGAVRFDGRDITHLSQAALRPLRRDMQVIFQDPMSSLNPRKTIGAIIAAPSALHGVAGAASDANASGASDARAAAAAALAAVGLPQSFAARYPHQLSGGQRQRVSVLYAGKVVEAADAATLFAKPAHAYTRALLAATPRYDRPDDSLLAVQPEVVEALAREIAESDSAWNARVGGRA